MSRFPARTVLGVLRFGVGLQSVATPRLAARAFGVAPEPSSFWVTRLFGSRELLLAYYLLTAAPERVQHAAAAGAVIDGIDVASSVVELRAGRISAYTFVTGGIGAAVFMALGLIAQAQTQPETPQTE